MTIYTLSMIKPDATKRNLVDEIKAYLTKKDFEILAERRTSLTKPQAEHFYQIHKDRSFFDEMIEEIISGDVVAFLLKSNNAVTKHRDVIGSTNPLEAEEGTIRKQYGISIGQNSIHGSDSDENALNEISFFFGEIDKIK